MGEQLASGKQVGSLLVVGLSHWTTGESEACQGNLDEMGDRESNWYVYNINTNNCFASFGLAVALNRS